MLFGLRKEFGLKVVTEYTTGQRNLRKLHSQLEKHILQTPHSRIPEPHSKFPTSNQTQGHYACWQGTVKCTATMMQMADHDDDDDED